MTVIKYQGRFTDAEKLYHTLLLTLRNRLNSDDPRLAGIYHHLGSLEHACSNYAECEPMARKAVELKKQELGNEHPEYAVELAALAAILDQLGKRDEAEPLYLHALEIFLGAYGDYH